MGGHYLSPFYLDGITDSKNMPFGRPLFDLSNPKFEAIYNLSTVKTSTKAGLDQSYRPLGGDRQELYPLTIQRGKYLDYLAGIKGLSESLKQEQVAGSDKATLRRKIPETAHAVIPELLLTSDFPPIFLVHGTADSVVSLDESTSTERQLKELGVETHLIAYEGGEHGFDNLLGGKAEDGNPIYEKLKPLKEWLKVKLE